MRSLIAIFVLSLVVHLSACGVSSKDDQSAQAPHSETGHASNPDLLSPEGALFPLSANFGVCTERGLIWKAELYNSLLGPHFPTNGVITMEGGAKLNITVGKVGLVPGSVVKELAATSLPRRIQVATFEDEESLVVSDFRGAGSNRVSITLDKTPNTRAEAMRLANSVVSCHIQGQ